MFSTTHPHCTDLVLLLFRKALESIESVHSHSSMHNRIIKHPYYATTAKAQNVRRFRRFTYALFSSYLYLFFSLSFFFEENMTVLFLGEENEMAQPGTKYTLPWRESWLGQPAVEFTR